MRRISLIAVVVFCLFALSLVGPLTNAGGEEKLWTLKYQLLAPYHFVVEKIVPVENPDNPDLPKLEKVYETYWYQVLYIKNPLKEQVSVPFNAVLLVDTEKTVRNPKNGNIIDVSKLMPGFADEGPNYVIDEATNEKLVIPGKAYRPLYEPIVRDKIIERIANTKVREKKFINTFRNSEPIALAPMKVYTDYLDMSKPMEAEEVRQVILIFKGLDPGFDRLKFRYGGITNEFVEQGSEETEDKKIFRKLLTSEYYRPGDEFATADTNPEEIDIFHLERDEWILEPIS